MHNSTAKKVQGIADWVCNMAGAIRFLSVFIRVHPWSNAAFGLVFLVLCVLGALCVRHSRLFTKP